ncbi:MAG TPA: hypothetical protein VF399_09980 [bacterium]
MKNVVNENLEEDIDYTQYENNIVSDNDDYEIYSVLLNGYYDEENSGIIVIDEITACLGEDYYEFFHLKETINSFIEENGINDSSLFNNFYVANLISYRLLNRFSVTDSIFLLTLKDCKKLGKQHFWKNFHKKYSKKHRWNSLFDLSRVGFNDDRTYALVYCSWGCDTMAGAGFISLFVKKEGKWYWIADKVIWET